MHEHNYVRHREMTDSELVASFRSDLSADGWEELVERGNWAITDVLRKNGIYPYQTKFSETNQFDELIGAIWEHICVKLAGEKDLFSGRSTWSTWVHKVAENFFKSSCRTTLRYSSRHRQLEDDERPKNNGEKSEKGKIAYYSAVPVDGSSEHEYGIDTDILIRIVQNLPELEKAVLVQRAQNKTLQQIADHFNQTKFAPAMKRNGTAVTTQNVHNWLDSAKKAVILVYRDEMP